MEHSLLLRLVIRLGLVLALVCAGLVWLFNNTLDEVGDRAQDEMLRRQAAELLSYLQIDRDREASFTVPRDVARVYRDRDSGYVFVLHDGQGNIVARSHPLAVAMLRPGLVAVPQSTYLDTRDTDGKAAGIYMLVRPVPTPRGMRYLTVGQARTIDDVLMEAAGRDATRHLLMWLVPAFGLVLVTVGMSVSESLRPLRRLSAEVKAVGPHNPERQLTAAQVPSEVQPLVEAVNGLLAQLSQALAAQQQLSADTAHQLKTPLAIMQARLESLKSFNGRDDLLADVRRMNRLVTQMLQYAQLMQTDIDLEPVNLTELAREVMARMIPLGHGRKVKLAFEAPELPVMVKAAPLLAAEAIQNLIDNAIQHSPAGKAVEVAIGLDGTVEIADKGPGVPATERDRIFSRFWQGEGRNEKYGSGSGLGLAIVAEIMRQHGGKVKVAERKGGGSVFTLSFCLNGR
ncbi:MAG: HAMP domain-containing histidine kinase [Pseudomonadaceae bacterium]|nr:HAMP domain-containing histidine kinase [Pseudomonadaceae bacterium]